MRNKYVYFTLLIIILVIGVFLFPKKKVVNKIDSIEPKTELTEKAGNTKVLVADNKNLILKKEVQLSKESQLFLDNRIKEYEAKVALFTKGTSVEEMINAYFILSADYRSLGEYGKAKEIIEKAMYLDSKDSNLIQVYSSLLALMGDKNLALSYINKAIAISGLNPNYWLWKLDLEKDNGVSVKSLELIYKNALKETGNDLNIVTTYAQFLEDQKRNNEAIIQWKKAIEIYPANKAIYQAEIDRLQKISSKV